MDASPPRVAVVGHVEWVRFARVQRVPQAGEIAHGEDLFEEPAGGGAVAAVQLARLVGHATLVTALGADQLGDRALQRLGELGVEVWAARRDQPTRTAVALVDAAGQRTITTFGARLHAGGADVHINWPALAQMDAIYFTAGDLGALQAARQARVLIASSRAGDAIGQGVPLDGLIFSGEDQLELQAAERARRDARVMISTAGARGGTYTSGSGSGEIRSWHSVPPPAATVDSYGCGDSFAAGLTYGLGARMALDDALALAARCGAWCLTGRGPYSRQLTAAEL